VRTLRGETASLELVVTALGEHAAAAADQARKEPAAPSRPARPPRRTADALKGLLDGALADAEQARADAQAARRRADEAEICATLAENHAADVERSARDTRADRDDKVAAARLTAAEGRGRVRRSTAHRVRPRSVARPW
jgi:hypothetical protein